MSFDDFLCPLPRLPKDRFRRALAAHGAGIIPLLPLTDRPLDEATRLAWDLPEWGVPKSVAATLDLGRFNVGLLCGRESGCVVLHVTTRSAQNWLDRQILPDTPQWFDGFARVYLFKSVDRDAAAVIDICPGVQIWNDGLPVTYPGSMWDDGRLVYWERAPDTVELAALPNWLLPHLHT